MAPRKDQSTGSYNTNVFVIADANHTITERMRKKSGLILP